MIFGVVCLVSIASTSALSRQTDRAEEQDGSLLQSRLRLLESRRKPNLLSLISRQPYPCQRHPHMCQAPFHCQNATMKEILAPSRDGRSNLRSWCHPVFRKFAKTVAKYCIQEENLRKNTMEYFNQQLLQKHNELDASYCFMEGHCTNMEVQDSTTREDAEAMCDRRYTHEGWTEDFVQEDMLPLLRQLSGDFPSPWKFPVTMSNGYHDHKLTKMMAKFACSMGNFHCDVQYCKRTYCSISHYRVKYSHLLPPVKGNELTDLY